MRTQRLQFRHTPLFEDFAKPASRLDILGSCWSGKKCFIHFPGGAEDDWRLYTLEGEFIVSHRSYSDLYKIAKYKCVVLYDRAPNPLPKLKPSPAPADSSEGWQTSSYHNTTYYSGPNSYQIYR